MNRLPPDTVRGRIRGWIERHADKLGDDVLEVGSRQHVPNAWWIVNRDLARGRWLGCDMQPGPGVDVVADIHSPPDEWSRRFSGIVCSEVLEHVRWPWQALPMLRACLRPGGWLVVTTLFSFPEHGFPDDFWRFSRSGLCALLVDAGFADVETEYAGGMEVQLDDHGAGRARRNIPMHVFAVAQRPGPAC